MGIALARTGLLPLAATLAVAVVACERPGNPVPPRSGMDAAGAGPAVAQSSGPSTAPGKASGSDAALTARVKAALIKDPQVKGRSIDVDTKDGQVTLHGALDTDDEVAHAMEVARGVPGVTNVVNRLTVKSEDKASRSNQG